MELPINQFGGQVDKLKGLTSSNPLEDLSKKQDELKKMAEDKINFLKKDIAGASAIGVLSALFVPIAKQIIKSLANSEKIKNKLIRTVQNQLRKKGKVEVQGKKIIFTPVKADPSYQKFADNFNRQVTSLQNALTVAQNLINKLDTILTSINAALTALKVAIQVAKIAITAKLIKISAELAAPTPGGVKPTVGVDLTTVIAQLDKIKELEKKIDDYQAVVSGLNIIVALFKNKIKTILDAINGLSLVIGSISTQINNPQVDNNLLDKLSTLQGNPGNNNINEIYGNYYLVIEKLQNGSYQAAALDKVSGFRITQTAPTKFLKPDALFNELKQILNT